MTYETKILHFHPMHAKVGSYSWRSITLLMNVTIESALVQGLGWVNDSRKHIPMW